MKKVKRVEFLSLFMYLNLILHLIFPLWKSVDHDQPLLHFSIPWLFTITLLIRSLLKMTINKEHCIAKAKAILNLICKQIYFTRIIYKVRSPKFYCFISSCVLNPLIYTTNYCFPCIFNRPPMIMIKNKMINCLCILPTSMVPCILGIFGHPEMVLWNVMITMSGLLEVLKMSDLFELLIYTDEVWFWLFILLK